MAGARPRTGTGRHPAAGRAPAATLLILLLLGPALIVGRVLAQDGEDLRRHGIFIDSLEVSLINVEVFATRGGEPVTDLTADDFELLDDGRPVEITHFARTGPAAGGGGEDTPAEADGAVSDSRPPAPEPARIIVLVDQLFLSPWSRARVFDALKAELEPLIDSGASIMVASKTREAVAIEQAFTASRIQIEGALDRLAGVASPGYTEEIRTVVDLWDVTPDAVESRRTGPGQPEPALQTSEIDAQSAFQDARGVSQRIHADARSSLAAAARFLDSLAGLPGRKALVYVADRLPIRPAELLWGIWWEKYGLEHGAKLGATPSGPSEFDLSTDLEDLISDANADRVAFYPIGTDSGPNLEGAESRGVSSQTRAFARATESGAGDGLFRLARGTGGRESARAAALSGFFTDLVRDLTVFYSLAYPSPHNGDGRIHRLEVRVGRPGIELRYPTQYRDKSADQRLNDRMLTTLTMATEVNDLDVRVVVGKAKKIEGGLFTVPLQISVPLANLVLLPDTTAHRGKLSIRLIARDARDRFSDPVVVRMPLEVSHDDISWALSQTVDYAAEMTLRDGSHSIAVGVRDELGLTTSTVAIDVDLGG